jgi:Fic family protein
MFKPRYHISPRLLAAIKQVTIQVHELNKQHLVDEATAALQQEALPLAAAAATGAGSDDPAAVNYGQALLELGDSSAADFDLGLLLRVHYRLNKGLLPEDQCGRLRRDTIPAGDPGSEQEGYWAPEPRALPALLRELVAFVQENQATLDPLLLAGLFHKQLLLIRPFAGDNGPAAWLATRILLSGLGLKTFKLLAVGDSFQRDRAEYRAALGARGNYYAMVGALDFTEWLAYFVEGISADLTSLEAWQRQRQASPATALLAHHRAILDYIDEHGFITDKQYAGFTERAKATRSLDFKRLMELGLLVREGKGRGTFYRRKS